MKSNIFGLSPNPYPYFWSRAMAIKLGHLVDLREDHDALISSLGFTSPMSMTSRAYRRYVEPRSVATKLGEDEASRLRVILLALANGIKRHKAQGRPMSSRQVLRFDCVLDSFRPRRCRLLAVVESGDLGEPVITFKELEYAERESINKTTH
jgi:hypothetical protein